MKYLVKYKWSKEVELGTYTDEEIAKACLSSDNVEWYISLQNFAEFTKP